jgi:hypothetical protein
MKRILKAIFKQLMLTISLFWAVVVMFVFALCLLFYVLSKVIVFLCSGLIRGAKTFMDYAESL